MIGENFLPTTTLFCQKFQFIFYPATLKLRTSYLMPCYIFQLLSHHLSLSAGCSRDSKLIYNLQFKNREILSVEFQMMYTIHSCKSQNITKSYTLTFAL